MPNQPPAGRPLPSERQALTRLIVPLVAALIGTAIYHRYSLLTGLDRVQADPGDSRFIAFLLEHWRNALHGLVDWRSPPIFWPRQDTLGYSDLLVGMGVVHDLLRSALPVFPAMNLQLILLSLVTFASAYLLFARGFALSVWGATAGAYFFAFSWPRFAQLVHVQLQFTAPLPILVLLALECLRDGRIMSRRAFAWRACAFSALFVLLLTTALYYAVFLALGVTVAVLLTMLHGRSRRHLGALALRQAGPIVLAVLVALVLATPAIRLYLPVMRASQGRDWAEVATFLPTPTHLLWMGEDNMVWGWLFGRWPRATIVERWPELRVGVGLVASLAWAAAIVWSVRRLRHPSRLDARSSAIPIVILSGFVLQLLMIRVPYRSAWWFVWSAFPGASGIRAVSRLELLVTLAMGLGIGVLVDRARRSPAALRAGLAAVALFAAAEQVGIAKGYSGAGAEALSRAVAAAIPPKCQAAYIVAPPDLQNPAIPVDEAHFDAAAYLAANPDVAAAWHGTAWEHYRLFGRAENRALDPAVAQTHLALLYFAYNYTIPLAADLGHVPVVNGLSGWTPPGWDLFDVLVPAAPAHLAAWLRQTGKPDGDVCIVPVRLTLDMMPDLPFALMP